MPIADGTSASDGTCRFGSNFLQAMHQARRRRAMQFIADHQSLLAAPEEAAASRLPGRAPAEGSPSAGPNRLGTLFTTVALALIALHAICAAMIIDRALAHGPEQLTISRGD